MRRLHRIVRKLRERVERRGVILMYHRVAELPLDPWALAVTPANFEAHLRTIRSVARPVSLRALAADLRNGVAAGSLAVTFDDGYLDNLTEAKPLLERYEIPATVFITSGKIGIDREFWWDELEQILLAPDELPERLELDVPGGGFERALGAAVRYGKEEQTSDRLGSLWEAPSGTRFALYRDVYGLLRRLGVAERDRAMQALAGWAGVSPVNRASHRTVSVEQLEALAAGGLIEIGAHTRTHTFLSTLTDEEQQLEILGSKRDVEQVLRRPIVSFAYPHGDAPRAAHAVVRQNFENAVGTVPQVALVGDDPWALPRFGVADCDGSAFAARFLR